MPGILCIYVLVLNPLIGTSWLAVAESNDTRGLLALGNVTHLTTTTNRMLHERTVADTVAQLGVLALHRVHHSPVV